MILCNYCKEIKVIEKRNKERRQFIKNWLKDYRVFKKGNETDDNLAMSLLEDSYGIIKELFK